MDWIIELVDKEEFIMCDWKDSCFNVACIFIEGFFYCEEHEKEVKKILGNV